MMFHPSKLSMLLLFTTLSLTGGGVSKPMTITIKPEISFDQKLKALKDSVDKKETRLIEETIEKYELVRKNKRISR